MTKKWSSIKLHTIGEKTGWRCSYCWASLDVSSIQVDHVQPSSLGGTNDMGNLWPCCKSCNSKKGNRTLEQFREIMSRKPSYVAFTDAQKVYLFDFCGVDIDAHTHNEPYQFLYDLYQ